MPQYIGKKLDCLMRLTNTTNALLGRVLNFDSSHISRIRANKRGVPHKQPFIDPVAHFFAKSISDPSKQAQAAQMICPGKDWPQDQEAAALLLSAWLNMPDDPLFSAYEEVEPLFQPTEQLPILSASPIDHQSIAFFYGNAGKREACIKYLSEFCNMPKPPTLLLYSDEDMTWFTEDVSFTKQWGLLLAHYLSNGGKIQIIHNVARDLHEMLTAIQKWMPLYMCGEIEAFYYPKLRDRVLRRTLFIAESHSAVISNSIGTATTDMLNILINNSEAVRALDKEFHNMLELCSPLMQIYRVHNSLALFAELSHFEHTVTSLITMGTAPPLYMLPADLVPNMESRINHNRVIYDRLTLAERVQQARENFLTLLKNGQTVRDILRLPEPSEIATGQVPVSICDFLGIPGLTYTAAEFAAQLRQMIDHLKSQPNYHVLLTEQIADNVRIMCREDLGAFVFPSDAKGIVFGINNSELSLSIWEYLSRIPAVLDRTETITALEKYIDRLLNFH